ncbi:MAG TPA: hypothetical protein PKD86_05625 [Gemmatales bacterium]|nr:hypothetical protein [Gemmatales bacterium]HMP58813.1 hypothetical protein [Gemmatales bacterium]
MPRCASAAAPTEASPPAIAKCCCCAPSECPIPSGEEEGSKPFSPKYCPCCVVDAVKVAPASIQLDLILVAILPPLDAYLAILPGIVEGLQSDAIPSSGPPLHLMQCVWRC